MRLIDEVDDACGGVDIGSRSHSQVRGEIAATKRSVHEGSSDLARPLDGSRRRVEAVDPIGLGSHEQYVPDEKRLSVDLAVELRLEDLAELR